MFNTRLHCAMIARDMTQQRLAEASGISKSGISQYLAGKNIPTKNNLIKLAEALDIPAEWLKHGDNPPDFAKGSEAKAKKLSIAQAAKLMGKGPEFVRIGLQQGTLPFGYAVKLKGKYSYFISSIKFTESTGIPVEDSDDDLLEDQDIDTPDIIIGTIAAPLSAAPG